MSIFFLFWWRSSLVLLYKKQISKSGFPIPVELCVSASRTKRSFFGCSWVALIIQDGWGIVAGWHHRDDLSAIFALVPALLVCKSRKSDNLNSPELVLRRIRFVCMCFSSVKMSFKSFRCHFGFFTQHKGHGARLWSSERILHDVAMAEIKYRKTAYRKNRVVPTCKQTDTLN